VTDRARSSRPIFARTALAMAVMAALGCGVAGFAAAQPTPGKVPVDAAAATAWTALTPAQQSALEPLKRDWPGIDAPRRQKWLEIAARMPAMSADERQRIQQRMAEWARLSPEERGRTRLQYQEVRQISPQERQALWDAYMALPAEERRALANSAKTVPQVGKSAASASTPQKGSPATSVLATPAPKAVAPTVVQATPGASTTLISKTAEPPPHAQAGQPKIAASRDVVDRRTLLPQAGPQATAPPVASAQTLPSAAAAPPPAPAVPPVAVPQPSALQAGGTPPAEATPPGQR
jgi:hypothetical protein